MPRSKKPFGAAVDKRNGQQAKFPAGLVLEEFALGRRADKQPFDLRTRKVWRAFWGDERLVSVLVPADRELVMRWIVSVDDAIKAHSRAWADPITKGSQGQDVKSPWFEVMALAHAEVAKCEPQLGIGALHRSRLGYAMIAEQRSLADLSAAYPGGRPDEDDPREG